MPLLQKPKRPHRRSLDALFPRPKVKRCVHGHSQTPEWKPHHGCLTCRSMDARVAETAWDAQQEAKAERLRESAKLRSLPSVYVMTPTHGPPQVFRPGPKQNGPVKRTRVRARV